MAQPSNETKRGVAVSERRLALAVTDSVCVVAAFVAAYNLYSAQIQHAGFGISRLGAATFLGIWFVCAWLSGVYDPRAINSMRRTVSAVLAALALELVGLLVIFFAVPYRVTRPTILLWIPIAAFLILGIRTLTQRLFGSVGLSTPTVIVSSPKALENLRTDLLDALAPFYEVVGVIDPNANNSAEKLGELVATSRASQIIVGVRDDVSRELFSALLKWHEEGHAVRSLADVYEELTGRALLDQLGHSWLMSLPMRSQTSRPYAALKRIIDVLTGLLALVVQAILLIPLALLIKLSSKGPLFHQQRRVGKYGHEFQITKLRTMRLGESLEWTQSSDQRVTAVGKVLRRLHLDELPQGWNIVRGDMSVVGPRPEQPQYVEELRQEIDFYSSRLVVRPGLTGWAQVNHGYGRGVEGARIKLSYDLYYIRNQSLSLDLLILVRTLFTLIALRGL